MEMPWCTIAHRSYGAGNTNTPSGWPGRGGVSSQGRVHNDGNLHEGIISGPPPAFRRIARSLSSSLTLASRVAQRLLVRPLHHSLVTHAVHALFPDNPGFVDYVIWEPRNSKHRRADREPAKVASGMKYGSRLELLCITIRTCPCFALEAHTGKNSASW